MSETNEIFQDIKTFIGFTDDDVASLRAMAPIFATHGAAITDLFYVKLAGDPGQSKLIEGRVDALKRGVLWGLRPRGVSGAGLGPASRRLVEPAPRRRHAAHPQARRQG